MILMPVGDIENIHGRYFVLFQNDARAKHVNFFPKVIEPNGIGEYIGFFRLYVQAGMPHQSGLDHNYKP
jgi:hypothetical protein